MARPLPTASPFAQEALYRASPFARRGALGASKFAAPCLQRTPNYSVHLTLYRLGYQRILVQDVFDTVAAVWPGGVVRIDELNRDAAVSAASYDGAPGVARL